MTEEKNVYHPSDNDIVQSYMMEDTYCNDDGGSVGREDFRDILVLSTEMSTYFDSFDDC